MGGTGEIRVSPAGDGEFDVEVAEGARAGAAGRTYRYHVTVDEPVLRAVGTDPADEAGLTELVHASFEFLLEREPAGAVLPRFGLSVISRYFPDYVDEVSRRLSG